MVGGSRTETIPRLNPEDVAAKFEKGCPRRRDFQKQKHGYECKQKTLVLGRAGSHKGLLGLQPKLYNGGDEERKVGRGWLMEDLGGQA